jgi:hypothetical protein
MSSETGRRRRRRTTRSAPRDAARDYYDASDDEEDAGKGRKGHVHRGACSLGRFCLNPCEAARSCWRQTPLFFVRQRRRLLSSDCRRRNLGGGLLVVAFLWTISLSRKGNNRHSLRHSSDLSLERMPVLIKAFDFSKLDVASRHKFPSLSSLKPLERPKIFDHGGLTFKSLRDASPSEFRREIASDDYLAYELYRKKLIKTMDQMYIGEYYDHDDETIELSCRRPNWKSLFLPNCNNFHEIDLTRDYDPKVQKESDLDYDNYLFK